MNTSHLTPVKETQMHRSYTSEEKSVSIDYHTQIIEQKNNVIDLKGQNKTFLTENEYLKRRVQDQTNQKKALISYINSQIPTITAETISKILNESNNMAKTPTAFFDEDFEKILKVQSKTTSTGTSTIQVQNRVNQSKSETKNLETSKMHLSYTKSNKDMQEAIDFKLSEKISNLDLSPYETISNGKAIIQQKSDEKKTTDAQYTQTSAKKELVTPFKNTTIKTNKDLQYRLLKLSNNNMECQIFTNSTKKVIKNSAENVIDYNENQKNNIANNFFVAGIEKNSFVNYQSKLKNNVIPDKIVLEPKIIFTYPEHEELTNNELRTSLKQAFPNDVHINRVKVSDCMSEINEIIFCDNKSIEEKIFSFPLMNYAQIGMKRPEKKQTVKEISNPNDFTYYVCLALDEFFNIDPHVNKIDSINASKKEFTKKFYTTKLIICIVTRYPFISFFKDFLTFIANSIKIERAKRFSETVAPNDLNVYSTIDSQFLLKFLEDEVRPTLTKLLQVRCPDFNETIHIENMHAPINFTIPKMEDCYTLEAEGGFEIQFRSLAFQEFILLYQFLLLEKTIILISEDMAQLTASVTTLVSLLKPFSWTYPMIASLPRSLYELLNSPVPIIVGLNMSREYFHSKQYSKISSTNNMVFVFLKEEKIEFDSRLLNQFLPPDFMGIFKQIEVIYKQVFEKKNKEKDLKSERCIPQNNNPIKEAAKKETFGSFIKGKFFGKEKKVNLPPTPSQSLKTIKTLKKAEITSSQRQKWGLHIIKQFSKALNDNIIAHLPKKPIFKNNNKREGLDFDQITAYIIKKNQVDEIFLNKFFQTQMFYTFLEEYYEID